MDESILTSIKKLLGIEESYEHFDKDIIMHINSAFMVLNQLGVGTDGYFINDASPTWADFLGENAKYYHSVVDYVYFKVRLAFDPPTSSFVLESYNSQIKELEWRLHIQPDILSEDI